MTRCTPLWSTRDVGVQRFDHAPGAHDHVPVEEIGERYSASFVERGGFDLLVDGDRWRLGPGDVLLIHPGMRYRVDHAEHGFDDVCLSVHYAAIEIAGADRARTWARARAPILRADHRLRYLHWGLRRALDGGTALLAETCAAELFREIPEPHAASTRAPRPRTLADRAERIHAARDILERRYGDALRLDALADAVGMSTFHFARLFADMIGMPPHRFLLETRLRAAAAMLGEGRSVTETCYACGFGDLSHFSRAFARHHGRSPSAWAAAQA
ncbi:MAG: helix-turn-helix domain-containing protein [Pseudomonadota bacterium]